MKNIKLFLVFSLSLNLISPIAFAEGTEKENKKPSANAHKLHNEVHMNENGQWVSTGTRKQRADDAAKALKRPDPNAAKKAAAARRAAAKAYKPPQH